MILDRMRAGDKQGFANDARFCEGADLAAAVLLLVHLLFLECGRA